MSDKPGNVNKMTSAAVLTTHPNPPKLPAPPPQPSKADLELGKLQRFLLSNFKKETGNETPVDCAIRLLGAKKK